MDGLGAFFVSTDMSRICLLLLVGSVLLPSCRTCPESGICTVNPPQSMPEVRAWCEGKELTMGADTGSLYPAVIFPLTAIDLGAKIRWGKPVQSGNMAVRMQKNGAPLAENCPVLHSFFATVDGLVGWPELRRHVWHLNYREGKHEFRETLPEVVRQWESIRLPQWGRPVVQIEGVGACLLDTGAIHAVYLPAYQWKRFLKSCPKARVLRFRGESPAAGGYFTIEMVQVKNLALGRLQLENVMVCESPFRDSHIVLGAGILEQVEVWLDGPNRRLYFRPFKTASSGQKVLSLPV